MIVVFGIIFFTPAILIAINTIYFFVTAKNLMSKWVKVVVTFCSVFLFPLLYLRVSDIDLLNDCCNDSATFSPDHRLGIYILILLVISAHFLNYVWDRIQSPIVHVLMDLLFISGFVFNVVFAFHLEINLVLMSVIPLILYFAQMIVERHFNMLIKIEKGELISKSKFTDVLLQILSLKAIRKFPLLLVLCLPFLTVFSLIMTLFGQKPDALILAFTQTYHLGLSQLDYMCDNVVCGGHYLCSVAANGDPAIVKPVRFGDRNGGKIICNRQLLVSNAFEEVIQEKWPSLHNIIRRNYDKVGDVIHKNYTVYEKKWVSNLVYILMKPLEWMFVFVLYLVDKKPENRIARQYVNHSITK